MTDRSATAGHCPHGIDRIIRYCEVCDAAVADEERLYYLQEDGSAHFLTKSGGAWVSDRCAVKFSAVLQIDELRECLILAVKELDSVPPVSGYTKSICVRARKALGLTAPCPHCGGHGMVGRPLDDDPGRVCEDCGGTGKVNSPST